MYTDGSLKSVGSADVTSGTVAYFPVLDMSISVAIDDFLSFTMAKLQVVALFLECNWVKIKSYSGVTGNIKTDFAAGMAAQSSFLLLAGV
ncbi:hypothetical protein G9A89_020314 [Geosiphon pyriformis]|nr:hypothetical protein G9A89_020314 [Geosiphon pyriformis]